MNMILKWIREAGRGELLFATASLGLTSSLLLTQPVWTLDRTYPLSPIIPELSLQSEVHLITFILSICALITSIIVPSQRKALLVTAISGITLLVLLDISRLQPWILHYIGILSLFLFCIPQTQTKHVQLLDAGRIIVGGIYFWSGIQKLNERFFVEIFPWFTKSLWEPLPAEYIYVFLSVALFVPVIEAGFALGFFTRKFRFFSILSSAGMLLLVLISIGPFGNNWNSSVWPWNVGIFLMVLILFYRETFTFSEFVQRQKQNVVGLICFLIFWVIPAGNFIGITDHYLSWSLYSGRVPEAILTAHPLYLDSLSPNRDNGEKLRFQEWTEQEMGTVPYPEERVFLDVFQALCEQAPEAELALEIMTPHFWRSMNKDITRYTCSGI